MRGLLITVLVLLGLAVVADRVAVEVAEEAVGRAIAERGHLAGEPDVEIAGIPFLTQVGGGRYDRVVVSLDAADLGEPAGTVAVVSLQGVHVPMSDVLAGSVTRIPVERIEGTATLSYGLLSDRLGPDATLAPEGDRVRITRTVDLAGVSLPLTAAGSVTLDGNDLLIDVDQASGAGLDVPGFLIDQISDTLDLRYPLDLPFGLRMTAVTATPDGVDVAVEASDTVLSG